MMAEWSETLFRPNPGQVSDCSTIISALKEYLSRCTRKLGVVCCHLTHATALLFPVLVLYSILRVNANKVLYFCLSFLGSQNESMSHGPIKSFRAGCEYFDTVLQKFRCTYHMIQGCCLYFYVS